MIKNNYNEMQEEYIPIPIKELLKYGATVLVASAAIIGAVKGLELIVNSEPVKQVPHQITEFIKHYLPYRK